MNAVKNINLTIDESVELKYYLNKQIDELKQNQAINDYYIKILRSVTEKLDQAEWQEAKLEDVIKEKARKNQESTQLISRGKQKDMVSQLVVTPIHTNAELGKIAGVSSETIRR